MLTGQYFLTPFIFCNHNGGLNLHFVAKVLVILMRLHALPADDGKSTPLRCRI